jgi:hypothetical protein
MEKFVKRKAIIMGREETCGSSGKKAFNCQISMVGYLQFVKTKHPNAALCSAGYGASTEARQLYRRLSLIDTAPFLQNGSVKPSGSYQKDGKFV